MSVTRVTIDETTGEASEYYGPTEIDNGQHAAAASAPRIRLDESHRFSAHTGAVETKEGSIKVETPWSKPGILSIGGLKVHESDAIAAGLAVRNPDGSIRLLDDGTGSTEGAVSHKAPEAEQQPDAEGEFIDEATNNEFAAVAEEHGISEGAFSAASAAAIGSIIRGEDVLASAAQAVVRATGMEPAQAREAVEKLGDIVQATFDEHVSGGDPEAAAEFYAYAREHHAGKLSAAINEALQGNSTKTLRSLVQDFERASMISEGEARAMGVHTFMHPQHGVLAVLGEQGNEQVVPLSELRRRYKGR